MKPPKSNDTEMPTRILGQTGERVSVLGLGGDLARVKALAGG